MAATISEVIRKLSQGFNQIFDDYKGLYLFGASVDGAIHEDEDIELAAIFDYDDQSKRKQIWPVVGKVETDMDVCIDLYPYTEETLKQDEEIFSQIKKNGIFYNKKGMKE